MKKYLNKKTVIIAIAVLLVLGVIGKRSGLFGKGELIKISTEKVTKRAIIQVITANGKVQPETEVKISPEVPGEIIELFVKEGDEVKKGILLLKIKPDTYISNYERIQATVNSTRANLANSKARLLQVEAQFVQAGLSYKRNKSLWQEKTISDSEFEQIEASYNVSKAEVEAARQSVKASEFSIMSAEASANEAKENLNKTTIYAPMDGTISKLSIEKGERVVGTAQMPGTELLRVADLNRMEILADVNENDIVNVKLGDTAIIEVDAFVDQRFKGIVTEIANSANTAGMSADQVTNFEVKILILKESYKNLIPANNPNYYPFRPGMSATVDIQTKTVNNVLSIPIQAVTTRIDSIIAKTDSPKTKEKKENAEEEVVKKKKGNEKKVKEVVFVYNQGKIKMQEVKTGIQDNNYIEIISGLTENEEIVEGPYSAVSKILKDNMDVNRVDKEKLFNEKTK